LTPRRRPAAPARRHRRRMIGAPLILAVIVGPNMLRLF
jgi:hypothetical protein